MNPAAPDLLASDLAQPPILSAAQVAPPAAQSCYRALGQRMMTLWLLKMTATAAGIASFFPAYFWVMTHAASRARVMPLLLIDHWIALNDKALLLYASLWFYVSLPAAFARNRTALLRYGIATGGMAVIGVCDFLDGSDHRSDVPDRLVVASDAAVS